MSRPRRPSSKAPVDDSDDNGLEEANPVSTKKKFSASEDSYLAYLVSIHGPNDWKKIAWNMTGRTVRQCRERWKYYLEPNINRKGWTSEEDELLVEKYREFGPKWAQITAFFENRTDIDLKNRYHKIERSRKRSERHKNAIDMSADPADVGVVPLDRAPIHALGYVPDFKATSVDRHVVSQVPNVQREKEPESDPLAQLAIHNLLNK